MDGEHNSPHPPFIVTLNQVWCKGTKTLMDDWEHA